jgi:hypothetical protein
MATSDADILRHNVAEAEQARLARAARDAALTPSERLERVDALCRQLAAIRPLGEDRR